MRALGTLVGATLVAISLSGCSLLHRNPPQQAQAPPLKTGEGSIEQQQKQNRQPPPPSTLPQPSAQTTAPALPPVKQPKVKRRKKPKPPDKTQSAAETQQAASQGPAAASPIGQLTAGDSATDAQTKRDTLDLIGKTEQGLGAIKRTLSSEEQATAAQIRTFLKQAKQALDNGDFDGAHTLATKAKLLLEELLKQ